MKKIFLVVLVFVSIIKIKAQCVADFEHSSMFCAGATFDFTSTSTGLDGSITTYDWTVDSEDVIISNSSSQIASIEFLQEGSYEVSLQIESGECNKQVTKTIEVYNAYADFAIVDTGLICGPDSIDLTNYGNANATNYIWNISELTVLGNTNNYTVETSDSILVYYFENPAVSDIELIVESAYACYDTLKIDSLVHVSFPMPAFTIDPPYGTDSTEVQIVDQSFLVDPDGYVFDWGNGSDQEYNLGETHTMVYYYDYTDSLDGLQVKFINMLAETDGCEKQYPLPFIVYPDPVIHIEASSFSGCPPFELDFTDNTTHIEGITDYYWDFGDGTTSTAKNPNHTYQESGMYSVFHSVTETYFNLYDLLNPIVTYSDTTWEQQIEVFELPEASFTYSNTVLCFGASEVEFEDTSIDVTDSLLLEWTIGEDTFTETNPVFEYFSSGTYEVNLLIEDQNTCTDDTTVWVDVDVIADDIVVDFNHAAMVCAGAPFSFYSDTSLDLGVQTYYTWSTTSDLVIIHNSTDAIGSISFTEEGVFPVTLTISNDYGCWGEVTKMVEVKNAYADFTTTQTGQLCGPIEVSINNLQNENATSYQWNIIEHTLVGPTNEYSITTEIDTLIYNFNNPAISDIELIVESAYSCYDTLRIDSFVDVFFPLPDFSFDITGCDSVNLEITDESFLVVDTFDFDFGNGDSQEYMLDSTHTSFYAYDYENASAYGQSYVLTMNAVTNSCPATKQKYFIIYPEPVIKMDASLYEGCPPLAVSFMDTSLYAIHEESTYFWDFGDGHTSTEQNPVHIYEQSGIFTVYHSITSSYGCSVDTTWEQQIEIFDLPEASFVYSNEILCFGATQLQFEDTSIDYTDSLLLEWTIEDTIFTESNPSYDFYQTNSYPVNLQVQDQNMCIDDTTIWIGVELIAEDVSVAFNHAPMICSGANFEFTPNPALDLGGETHYTWSTSSDTVLLVDSIGSPGLAYFSEEGFYPLTLTVSNDAGCLEEATQWVEVKNAYADFMTTQTGQQCGPLDISISNLQNNNATSYQWNITEHTLLGPINNYTVTTVDSTLTYFFKNPALSDVELIVESAYACYDTLSLDTFVDVFFPLPYFALNPSQGCDTMLVEVIDQSFFVDSFSFDFGNDSVAEYALNDTSYMSYYFDYPNGTYEGQEYTLTMNAVTNTCPTTFDTTFTIYPNPEIQISASSTAGCPPFELTLFDSSFYVDSVESSYYWDFGDGFTSTERNPTHVYENTGFYTVYHSVTTPNGCVSDTVWETQIEVYEMPVAAFTHLNPTLCYGYSYLQFLDASYDPTDSLMYEWDFSVGTSTNQNPLQEFLTATVYEVSLQIQDQHSCIDSVTNTVEVTLLDTFVVQPEITYVTVEENAVNVKWAYTPDYYFDNLSVYHQEGNGDWSMVHNTDSYLPGEYSHLIFPIDEQNSFYLVQQDSCFNYSEPSEVHTAVYLSASSTSYQTVSLEWTPYVGWDSVASYEVYRSLENEDYKLLAKLHGDSLSYQDSSLCNSVYSYYVVAIDANSSYESKSNKALIIPDFVDYASPLLLQYTSVSSNDKIYTLWDTYYPSDMTYYKIDRWDDYFGWIENYAYASEPPFVDGDVGVHHRNYIYRISYADDCGNEGPVGRVGMNVLLEASQYPSHYELNWSEYNDWDGGVSEHLIQYFNEDLNAFQNIATVSGTTFNYVDTDLEKDGVDTSYCYRVVAVSAENSEYRSISNEQCFVPEPKVYFPNAFSPNNDGINEVFAFKGDFAKEMKIEIYNRLGKLMFSSNEVDFEWDGTDPSSGEVCPQGQYVVQYEMIGYEGTFIKNDMFIFLLK